MQRRYFIIRLKNNEAIVCVDINQNQTEVINCKNIEFCYMLNILGESTCPQYCPILTETKNYVFRNKEPLASIHEISESLALNYKSKLLEKLDLI